MGSQSSKFTDKAPKSRWKAATKIISTIQRDGERDLKIYPDLGQGHSRQNVYKNSKIKF